MAGFDSQLEQIAKRAGAEILSLDSEAAGAGGPSSDSPVTDWLAADSVHVYELPGRVPTKALAFSVLALAAAGAASLLMPASVEEYSALVWLLAIVPAFLFAYYKGWQGATIALISAMLLICAVEVVLSILRGVEVAWWLVGGVTVLLMSVGLGAGLISEGHRRKTADALKLAYADPLTGLPNRRVLKMFLRREFEATHRGLPCAIVVLDIDRFKSINDTQGHQAGDDVLRTVARALDQNTRASDVSGRFGGDEFLSLLPGAGARGAKAFAERVRKSVAAGFEGSPLSVTLSVGVAVSNSHTKTEEDLLQAADLSLYSAKREGGDRVVVAGVWPLDAAEPESSAEPESAAAS